MSIMSWVSICPAPHRTREKRMREQHAVCMMCQERFPIYIGSCKPCSALLEMVRDRGAAGIVSAVAELDRTKRRLKEEGERHALLLDQLRDLHDAIADDTIRERLFAIISSDVFVEMSEADLKRVREWCDAYLAEKGQG